MLKYILVRDKYKREPMRLVFWTFGLGAILFFLAFIIELLLQTGNSVLDLFLVVAVSEEFVKFAAVRLKAFRSRQFYEVMDGVVFGVAAALGFATVENILSVFQYGYATAILRAFMSVPNHAAWGGIMGYYVGVAKTSSKHSKLQFIATGLGIAIVLHGTYDSVLEILDPLLGIGAGIVLTLVSWAIFLRLITQALSRSSERWRPVAAVPTRTQSQPLKAANRFCTECGAGLEDAARFCIECGHTVPIS